MKKWYWPCLHLVTRKLPNLFRYFRFVPSFSLCRPHFSFSAKNCLIAAMIIYGLLLFISLLIYQPGADKPSLAWAPGYWQALPRIGMARIVPFAGWQLRNPAASTGDKQVRQPASP